MNRNPITGILLACALAWFIIKFPKVFLFMLLAPFALLAILVIFLVWAVKRGRLRHAIRYPNGFAAHFGRRQENQVYKDVEIKVVDK